MEPFTFIIICTFLMDISVPTQNTWCNQANSCGGNIITLSKPSDNPTLYGNGYQSLYGTAISVNITDESSCGYATLMCGGAFACNNIQYVENANFIKCYGSNTCSNINGDAFVQTRSCHNADKTFWGTSKQCLGSNACQYVNFKNTNNIGLTFNNVQCYGDQSCAYTNIQKSGGIEAYAAYSLYNAVIDSKNLTSALSVALYGYHAGFGSKVICRSGDTCDITCYGNGCEGLYVQCEDKNNCNIQLNPFSTIEPIMDNSQFDKSKLNLLYNSSTLTRNNDVTCSEEAMNFDEYQQRGGYNGGEDIVTATSICCRGKESCTNIDNIMIQVTLKQTIVCSGDSTCSSFQGYGSSPIIKNNGPIYCEGYKSCIGSSIISDDNIYCFGNEACKGSTITGPQNVYCSGSKSCISSTIISGGTDINIYLLGYFSRPVEIHCNQTDNCFILCGGPNTCSLLDEILFCDGICTVNCADGIPCPTTNPSKQPTTESTLPSIISPSVTTKPSQHPTIFINTIMDLTNFTNSNVDNIYPTQTNNKNMWIIYTVAIAIVCVIVIGIVIIVAVKFIGKRKNNVLQHVELIECNEENV